MPLSAGTRLGGYEIVAPIGAGGMGEVYHARDTKLKRDVALKVLPDTFADDPARIARFQREAEVLASLNHPNIAQIYGIEQRALVMELVAGEPLKGPLPLPVALGYAGQIADALQAAHEKGITHRDLKPANIMLTPADTIKVLDFGLAAVTQASGGDGDPSLSPTLTLSPTQAGMILGTAAYMSPEQARGKRVDQRADIWAFGVVLYEILTGRQLFQGETTSDTLAAVLMREPDLGAVPEQARRLLESCLQKDPKQRLQAIGDWRLLLTAAESRPASARTNKLAWVAAAVLGMAAAIAFWAPWRAAPVARALRLSVDLGSDALAGVSTTAAISPDGARLIFPARGSSGRQMLATRLLDQPNSTVLGGTDNGSDPFFSPDGQWIGFFADGKLKKISVQGGAAVTLADAPNPRGGDWGEDGRIIFEPNTSTGLFSIDASSGIPQALTRLNGGEVTHRWPQVLPGGNAVLFTVSNTSVAFEAARITAYSFKTGQQKTLLQGGYFARYLPLDGLRGELVYVSQGVLFGVPFDASKLELRGAPAPLLSDVAANPSTGSGQFGFSRTGTLIYQAGKPAAQSWPLVWLDSAGNIQPLLSKAALYSAPRFSPDGMRLVFSGSTADQGGVVDIFVYEWQRDTVSRLTFNGRDNFYPTWSPDGKHIAFRALSNSGASELEWLRADGSGEAQQLLETRDLAVPYSFSPDGRRLAYTELKADTGLDLWTLPLDLSDPDHPKAGKPEVFLRTPAGEAFPAFSPDGRWIAYQSNESGRFEVYVRPFPGPGGRWQISSGGGQFPMWSRNGHELFYETPENRIMVGEYAAKGDTFVPDKPRLWSNKPILSVGTVKNLDLASDGKRFVVPPLPDTKQEENRTVHVTFVLNFFDELRRTRAGR